MQNILLVATPSYWRGGEVQIAGIAFYLQQIEPDLHPILLCRKGSELEKYCIKHSLEYVCFKGIGLLSIKLARVIARVVRQKNIKLIHANDSKSIAGVAIACSWYKVKCPIVLSRRIVTPIHNTWFSKFKYNHKQISKIICDSKANLHGLSPAIKSKERLTVVYPFVDISKFQQVQRHKLLREKHKISDNEILIGNIAALTAEKDIQTTIKVAEHLTKTTSYPLKFTVIGDGKQRKELEELIETKGLKDKFILAGFHHNIAELIKDLDYFVLTSQSEGLGLVLIEAQAANIPVVATNVGGISEVITDGESGLLAQPEDYKAISANIVKLIEDDNLRKKIVENGAKSCTKFSPESCIKQVAEIYVSCINQTS